MIGCETVFGCENVNGCEAVIGCENVYCFCSEACDTLIKKKINFPDI